MATLQSLVVFTATSVSYLMNIWPLGNFNTSSGRSSKPDFPGTHNIHDDIRVVGTLEEEYDERLNQVMKKLKKWFDTEL